MKKIWLLALTAVLILSAFSAAFAEEAEGTGEADLFDILDSDGESLKWLASAVPVSEGVLVTSPALLPDSPEHLVISDGAHTWEPKAVIPDDTGMTAMIFFDPQETPARFGSWHLLPLGQSVPAASCRVCGADGADSRIEREVLSSEETTLRNRRCLLLSLTGPAPLGSAVLTEDGQLAGVVVAAWAEGINRVVALPAEEMAKSLTAAAALLGNLPEWGNAPEGLTVTAAKNLVTIDWKDMALPEKAEGEELYLVLLDTGNSYLNYYPAETERRAISLLLTPGRFYLAGVVAAAEAPDGIPEFYATISVPQAKKLTDYQFRPVLTAVAEAPETGLEEGVAPVPVTEVNEELLRSERAYFYSHSTYEVTETVSGKPLLITLTAPNGVNYRYESSWVYAPEYMAEDIWYLPLKETGLTAGLDQTGYPAGVYRIAYYVDGDLADSFEFELK